MPVNLMQNGFLFDYLAFAFESTLLLSETAFDNSIGGKNLDCLVVSTPGMEIS
jgi:hypothetical protein